MLASWRLNISKLIGWMCNTEKFHRKIRGGILLTEFCFSMEYIGKNTVGYPLTG